MAKGHPRKGRLKELAQRRREFSRSHSCRTDMDPKTAFMFGARRDGDGYPFIVGLTSVALIENCLNHASRDRFALMHADATFKLSDLEYPVITCGFTDQSRTYQLAAVFMVSQRTTRDYRLYFGALVALFGEIRGRSIHVDAVMGGAQDAQASSIV